jgi:hypothetical protein
MFAAALGPALLQCCALALCPESPVWLLRVGHPARAAKALRRLHGSRLRPQDHPKLQLSAAGDAGAAEDAADGGSSDAQQPLLAAEQGSGGQPGQEQEQQGQEQHLGWSALWQPRYRRVMILAAALPLAQQASGINTVIFFSTQVRLCAVLVRGMPRQMQQQCNATAVCQPPWTIDM